MVDVKEVAGVMSLLVGPPEAGLGRPTRSYDVSIKGDTVHVDGVPIQFSIVHPAWAGHARAHAAHADGPQQVTAPMPGKIVRLLVKPGDRVHARQGLVVVEAMKMENELRARAAGTVADVRAIEGMTVEAGAILIVLE
jgi:biotin carboxyl carrier protein